MKQARFFVLEGLDGAGTTTQAQAVSTRLRGAEQEVLVTAEPSDGPLGRVLRQHLQQELTLDTISVALLFSADRADHLARVVRPALRRGTTVVCDRYLLSTLAYQGAEGVDREWILEASRPFEIPDLTVFLDLPDAERAGRLAARNQMAERYEDPELAGAIRDSYLASIELLRDRGHRIEVVDGSPDPDRVTAEILGVLDAPTAGPNG